MLFIIVSVSLHDDLSFLLFRDLFFVGNAGLRPVRSGYGDVCGHLSDLERTCDARRKDHNSSKGPVASLHRFRTSDLSLLFTVSRSV